jgi:hypothetical protein
MCQALFTTANLAASLIIDKTKALVWSIMCIMGKIKTKDEYKCVMYCKYTLEMIQFTFICLRIKCRNTAALLTNLHNYDVNM